MSAPEDAAAQWAEAERWLAKADEDVAVRELALAREPPLTEPAAFHCQQAGEKILKALLIAAGVAPARNHDMERLVQAAAPLYPTLSNRMQTFARLTEWLTATRYPDLGGGLGETPSDVAEMALIKAFEADPRALAPFRV
ncbi:MAG TPA: HEPN domain-containing protein [Roseiarcus sp.]|jgi:HEPN domain-containing protein|nr:HEPN domain-containing protein [Roseiarcus sp.]